MNLTNNQLRAIIKEEFKPVPSAELENSINQMIFDDYGDY